jgi:hypothetical protein
MLLSCELSERQCSGKRIVPENGSGYFGNFTCRAGSYAFVVNQIAIATMTTTIAAHIKGVTFFVAPLRGESLGAWL